MSGRVVNGGGPADTDVRGYFSELVTWANSRLTGNEILTCYLAAENSSFVRFNHNLIRQAGTVTQRRLTLDLIAGTRHASGSLQLSQDGEIDRAAVGSMIDRLREQRRAMPEDPYLAVSTDNPSTEQGAERSPRSDDRSAAAVVDEIQAVAGSRDLVGIYADGAVHHGFASSLGQRNWYQADTFNFDWSFYIEGDKAVKNSYGGQAWNSEAFAAKVAAASRQLESLAKPAIDLKPGRYRTYLSPTAVQQLLQIIAWGGFGLKAHRTKQTPLLQMAADGARLHPSVRLAEDTAGGTGPNFQEQGFVRPEGVTLIDDGRLADQLVSPRSAVEYGVATNGASNFEQPMAMAMTPGTLETNQVLDELGTGLLVGNLWYLNFSDRTACRTTGMTRFATFWVEGGEIVAPANVMRFDDTIYNLLGNKLVGLTDSAETLLDASTYQARSTASARLPGAVVEEMAFTL